MTETNAPRRPVLLIILDGFGVNPAKMNNAVSEAKTPRFDAYFAQHMHTVLEASGRAVGLPDGQMGNSEVGHLTLGCGSVLRQDLVRIDDAIADGGFFVNTAFMSTIEKAKAQRRPVHLIGLVSDGGVHSHIRHLLALIQLCQQQQVKPLLHMITDGRDTAPQCALRYVAMLQPVLKASGGAIATISGRYYAMDRDQRWERTQRAWQAIVRGQGIQAEMAQDAIEQAYAKGQGDEFIEPVVLPQAESIQADDGIIFFNFRNDRPKQLTEALTVADFVGFERGDGPLSSVTTMTEYDPSYGLPVAFAPERPGVTLAKVVSEAGLKQFHCAETEKYAHVTFFFNGGEKAALPGEERVLVPSPKVATYDLKPEMSAPEVADAVIQAIAAQQYALIVVNFANGDMVGHTAIRAAVIKAVEVLDREVGRVLDAAVAHQYAVLMTADHGNCDELIDPVTGQPHTQHSTYPVPCLIIDKTPWRLKTGAGLDAVAPTLLQLMGIPKPVQMRGESLLVEALEDDS